MAIERLGEENDDDDDEGRFCLLLLLLLRFAFFGESQVVTICREISASSADVRRKGIGAERRGLGERGALATPPRVGERER